MADFKFQLQKEQYDLRPACYDEFHCLAENCRLSCCKEWNISFDKADYLKLKQYARIPALSESLAPGLMRIENEDAKKRTGHYGYFQMKNGICPLLSETGLCRLQLNSGEEALPFVCRTFPRRENISVSGYLERSMSPGCEAVLYQLWKLPEGVEFRSDLISADDSSNYTVKNVSSPLIEYHHEIRSLCIDLLQDRRFPLSQRVLLMGLRLQSLTQEQEEIPNWLTTTEGLLTLPETAEIVNKITADDSRALAMFVGNNISLLCRAFEEVSNRSLRNTLLNALGFESKESTPDTVKIYQQTREKFEAMHGEREYFFENLAVSLFFHLRMPTGSTLDEWWKSYVNFCNILSFYRFLAVLSTTAQLPPVNGETLEPGSKEALIYLLVCASRALLHNSQRSNHLRDEFFQNDSATLAHMAILLCG